MLKLPEHGFLTMNKLSKTFLTAISTLLLCSSVLAADNHHLRSKYAGQETRVIKSLSTDDIKQLTEGRGWGLAKAAELNGIPGPAHLLEMKSEISLTESQVGKIERLFNEMNARARPLGKKLIDLEADLNQAFASKSIDKADLKAKLAEIEKVRAELRYVHLATHLDTPSILKPEQITLYNQLRGYGDDPCKNIPAGHDREMWLLHNNCK